MSKYVVGTTVIRQDDPEKRFYVPVSRTELMDGVSSQIVLRVASDAFPDEAQAVAFANAITDALNDSPKYMVRCVTGEFLRKYAISGTPKSSFKLTNLKEGSKFSSYDTAASLAKQYVAETDGVSLETCGLHIVSVILTTGNVSDLGPLKIRTPGRPRAATPAKSGAQRTAEYRARKNAKEGGWASKV